MTITVSEEIDLLAPGVYRGHLIHCPSPMSADDLQWLRVWQGRGEKLTIAPGAKIERLGPTLLRVSGGENMTYSWAELSPGHKPKKGK